MTHKQFENKNVSPPRPRFCELIERLREFAAIQISDAVQKQEVLSKVQSIIQETPSLKVRTGLALSLILARSKKFRDGTGLEEEVIVDRVCVLTMMEREDAEIMVPYILYNLPGATSTTVPVFDVWKEP
ncbi:MAG: hypothetical protein FIB07_17955 [Candidatus Methanoperedens sp.]|nr:hypothetical protein [Candidatus Methanoperedens sp.]